MDGMPVRSKTASSFSFRRCNDGLSEVESTLASLVGHMRTGGWLVDDGLDTLYGPFVPYLSYDSIRLQLTPV